MPTAWACVPWTKGPKWANLSFSSVFHSGFDHEYPATHCDQGRDPWPCSLHRRNVCAHYWLHWHHWKPPSPLCILQVQKFLLWLICVALSFTCAHVQISPLLSTWIKSNGNKCGGKERRRQPYMDENTSMCIIDNLSVNLWWVKEPKWEKKLFYKQFPIESLKNGLILLKIETTVLQL